MRCTNRRRANGRRRANPAAGVGLLVAAIGASLVGLWVLSSVTDTPADGQPTYNSGVRLSDIGRAKVETLARVLAPYGIHVHITSGDRTAEEQARAMLSNANLDAYDERTRNAFAGKPRDTATWTAIVSALQQQYGTFTDDHMGGHNADLRTRDLRDDNERNIVLREAAKIFRKVGRITTHLHLGW